MLYVDALIVKLVKKMALAANYIAFIEKSGEFFYHVDVSEEICEVMEVAPNVIVGKSLMDLYPLEMAKEYRRLYEKAWLGQEVKYNAVDPIKNEEYCIVLSPIVYQGKTSQLMMFMIEKCKLPLHLQTVA